MTAKFVFVGGKSVKWVRRGDEDTYLELARKINDATLSVLLKHEGEPALLVNKAQLLYVSFED
jgi:hypothetical protein